MIIQGNDSFTQPSFPLGHRARRQVWSVAYALLFRLSPRPCHAWRARLLTLFGATLGKDCHVYPGVRVWAPWNLRLGDHVGIADGVTLYSMDLITIGDRVVISQGAYLCCGTHDYESPNMQLTAKPITIGRRAWVCAQVFVHPGVSVAEGAVVGARSVVTRSLDEPWAVYAGNPCVKVKDRPVIADTSDET